MPYFPRITSLVLAAVLASWKAGLASCMIPWQRRVAKQEGCAFFSIFDAMGGEGSMGRWYRAQPKLGWADLAHTTREGSRVLGSLFYKSLMKGFADYLDAL